MQCSLRIHIVIVTNNRRYKSHHHDKFHHIHLDPVRISVYQHNQSPRQTTVSPRIGWLAVNPYSDRAKYGTSSSTKKM